MWPRLAALSLDFQVHYSDLAIRDAYISVAYGDHSRPEHCHAPTGIFWRNSCSIRCRRAGWKACESERKGWRVRREVGAGGWAAIVRRGRQLRAGNADRENRVPLFRKLPEQVEAPFANRNPTPKLLTHVGHESDGEYGKMSAGLRCTKGGVKNADSDRNESTQF